MTAIAVLLVASQWITPTAELEIRGRATYYAPHRFEEVLANRGIDLPPGVVPVALNRRGDFGRRVWLRWPDGSLDAGLVVDCAQERHFAERERRGLVAEVPAELAGVRGFYLLGPYPVTVLFVEPKEMRYEPV